MNGGGCDKVPHNLMNVFVQFFVLFVYYEFIYIYLFTLGHAKRMLHSIVAWGKYKTMVYRQIFTTSSTQNNVYKQYNTVQ